MAVATAHRCPPGQQTPRAERLALLTDPRFKRGDGKPWSERETTGIDAEVAEHRQTMQQCCLCETCGYPLDGSYPHPESERARFERRGR